MSIKMKNILFLVTGMTPQIITETVWALSCDPNNDKNWLPDEIYVLTTQHGFNLINTRLLEKGIFDRLKQDYPQLKDIKFDKSHIDVITCDDKPLTDLKTPKDNELTADLICEKVRKFTQDDDVCLYVSIAGGRKTMGFYAGYALSLYGRSQDKMSHILAEEDFENVPDFYYPTPYDLMVTNNKGNSLNAKNAKVWLADIAFVRMRGAIMEKHALKGDDSFSQVVEKINLSFQEPKLKIDVANKSILVNNSIQIDDLDPKCFAFLHWFANLRISGEDGIIAPNKKWEQANQAERKEIEKLTIDFSQYYEILKTVGNDFILDKTTFENTKSNLKTALNEKLSTELAKQFEITQDKRRSPFYLNIDPNNIEIVDSFAKKPIK